MLVVVSVVVIALVVVAIALVSVGKVTAELGAAPPRTAYDLDEAVQFVADRLSDETTAQLSYADVADLLGRHLDYLQAKGVASLTEPGDGPAGPMVAVDDEAIAFVLGRADDAGLEVDDEQVAEVIDASEAYLVAIGAVGAEVPPPPDPTVPT